MRMGSFICPCIKELWGCARLISSFKQPCWDSWVLSTIVFRVKTMLLKFPGEPPVDLTKYTFLADTCIFILDRRHG